MSNETKKPEDMTSDEWKRSRTKGNLIIGGLLVAFVFGLYGFYLVNTATRAGL